MDGTVHEENVRLLLEPKPAGCSANSEVTESATVAVISNTGASPCFVSETLAMDVATPASSAARTRPRPRPRLDALVKNDALAVLSNPLAETSSPSRVYVTDDETEQRFNYLRTQDLDEIGNGVQRHKTNNKIFRKGHRKPSGALSVLQKQSKPYFEPGQLQHPMKKNASILIGRSRIHELWDSPEDSGHTACDILEHKAELSVSKTTAGSMNQVDEPRGAREKVECGLTYFAAGQTDHAVQDLGEKPKAELSMPCAIAQQLIQTGEVENEKTMAGHTASIIVGERMSQLGKKGVKKEGKKGGKKESKKGSKRGGKKAGRKQKANEKRAEIAEKRTNKDYDGGETQSNGPYAKEDTGDPGMGVRVHAFTEEQPLDLQSASKHRKEAVEPIKVDSKLSDNSTKTTLSM